MMDADTDIRADMVGVSDQNGVQYNHCVLGEEGIAIDVNGSPDSTLVGASPDGLLNGNKTIGSSTQEVEELTDAPIQNNGSSVSQDLETTEISGTKESKPQNSRGKGKNEKPTNKINAMTTSVKKNFRNKELKETSNGTLSTNTTKQPIVKAKSFNERRATASSNPSKITKLVSATSIPLKAKPLKSEVMSGSDNVAQSEDIVDTPKLRSLRKESTSLAEGIEENIESPTASDDSKARRVGKLPSYGFNFRCHERAEKRKEFYNKLEEKNHAQEVEKSNMQAKSKETQEAEIKKFRKSLNFKATPMPNFYQEPAPAKELKKIPTTRPRSPKLGRKKNPSSVEAEGNCEPSDRLGRLSLDEKAVLQTNPSKGPSSVQPKRPQRKSLPRLPSEKTRLSKNVQARDNMTNGSPPIARVEEEDNPESAPIARAEEDNPGSVPIARAEEEVLTSDSGEAQSGIENGRTVEDQTQLATQQEVVVEH